MEPGTDRPQFPRPFEIALNNGLYAYKEGCSPLVVNDIIYAFAGPNGDYGNYSPVNKGTSWGIGALTITISDDEAGKVISIS